MVPGCQAAIPRGGAQASISYVAEYRVRGAHPDVKASKREQYRIMRLRQKRGTPNRKLRERNGNALQQPLDDRNQKQGPKGHLVERVPVVG
eukprot:12734709-Alexandrium_andersonii.AAC.1